MTLFRCEICNRLKPDCDRVKPTRGIKISDNICRKCARPMMEVRSQFRGIAISRAIARKKMEKQEEK